MMFMGLDIDEKDLEVHLAERLREIFITQTNSFPSCFHSGNKNLKSCLVSSCFPNTNPSAQAHTACSKF